MVDHHDPSVASQRAEVVLDVLEPLVSKYNLVVPEELQPPKDHLHLGPAMYFDSVYSLGAHAIKEDQSIGAHAPTMPTLNLAVERSVGHTRTALSKEARLRAVAYRQILAANNTIGRLYRPVIHSREDWNLGACAVRRFVWDRFTDQRQRTLQDTLLHLSRGAIMAFGPMQLITERDRLDSILSTRSSRASRRLGRLRVGSR